MGLGEAIINALKLHLGDVDFAEEAVAALTELARDGKNVPLLKNGGETLKQVRVLLPDQVDEALTLLGC